jgi:CubicO group peptidase (beta-lactamase class C family)
VGTTARAGTCEAGRGLPEDARFEIGSITKTMTAALLASLAGDGVLALEDEIGRWLDAGPNGNITLEQLATHTSGLPRLAPNQPTGVPQWRVSWRGAVLAWAAGLRPGVAGWWSAR